MELKKFNKKNIIISALLAIIFVMIISIIVNFKFLRLYNVSEQLWSIGMYSGSNLLNLQQNDDIKQPILSAEDVTDIKAKFVADPFFIEENGVGYLFFEILEAEFNKGVIGVATSNNMKDWKYEKVILEEGFHLSYPYIFKYENDFYMMPEKGESGYLSLYKAENFPYEWTKVADLLRGNYIDSSIFQYNDKWWILTTKKEKGVSSDRDNLRLYYSDNLFDGWVEHSKSPLITNNSKISRMAGRVLVEDDKIIRFTQNDEFRYGKSVDAFEIIKLTEDEYEEVALGTVLNRTNKDGDWNKDGMHHIDVRKVDDKYIAIVDGDYEIKYNQLIEVYKQRFFTNK